MLPKDLQLRCYLEPERDGSWFAICIDLNLSVTAGSADEAKEKLHHQIHHYIEEAYSTDSDYFDDLVPRLAPLSFRIKYHLIDLICRVRDNAKRNRACLFTDRMPLKPA